MKIVFTPDWFLNFDVIVEVFSFIVLLTFLFFAIKSYKIDKNRKTLYLGLGFTAIALAEIVTILTKIVLYYDMSFTREIGQAVVTYHVLKSVDWFYYLGFFLHKLFTLGGLYLIYKIPSKKGTPGDFILGGFFVIVAALFSNTMYFVFHVTAMFLLFLIIQNYWKVYQKNKSENTKTLILAFSILFVSQLLFIVSFVGAVYALAQIFQLVGYIAMLLLIIKITKYGKKKNTYKDRL